MVTLYDEVIGSLELDGDRSQFQFTKSYIEHRPRPILSRRYEDQTLEGLKEIGIHSKLPSFWSNYLPTEGSVLRKLLAAQAGVREHSEFRLLIALGKDLPGAAKIELDGDETSQDVSEFAAAPLENSPLKFSLAGMQLKFSMTSEGARMTIPMTGEGGDWIVKMPDTSRGGVPELEHATMTWAKESALSVPEFKLVPVAQLQGIPVDLLTHDQQAFAIRRYDRAEDNKRIHQEDFNQLLGCVPDAKYNHNGECPGGNYLTLASLIRGWCGLDDCKELFRRLVFMVFSGNADAHLKNWSLYYPNPLKPQLAPAYDLVATIVYPELDHKLALKFLKTREFNEITIERFEEFTHKIAKTPSERAELMQTVRDAIKRTHRAWIDVCNQFSDAQRARIDAHVRQLPLLKG